MDLVALVSVVVLGVLGVIALTKKGRIHWESHTDNSINKVDIEGGTKRKQ